MFIYVLYTGPHLSFNSNLNMWEEHITGLLNCIIRSLCCIFTVQLLFKTFPVSKWAFGWWLHTTLNVIGLMAIDDGLCVTVQRSMHFYCYFNSFHKFKKVYYMTDYVNSHRQKGKQKKVQRNMFGDFPLGF